jgi:hypothetical protein
MADIVIEAELTEMVTKVGVIITIRDKIVEHALGYLLLHQNMLQSSFEFQLLPVTTDDYFKTITQHLLPQAW